MKGPFENGKVYAIAAVSKAGIAGGVIPAVYAYDKFIGEQRFFTVNEDEFDENDLYEERPREGDLRLDSSEEPAWHVPDRQVLSLWSEREEALVKFKERSARGKSAARTAKDRKNAAQVEKLAEERKAREETPLGRMKKITNSLDHAFYVPARHGYPDRVHVSLVVTPEKFRRMMTARGVDEELIDEFFANDNDLD